MSWIAAHGAVIVWVVCAASTLGVLVRPFGTPEAVWAAGGALAIVLLGLLPVGRALAAVGKGTDVYLFLVGMMLLSETARRVGLFDWVAGAAVAAARGSTKRLFFLIFAVGVVVTTFLSNDATAVVLTPAVYAATRKASVKPLPFLFVCAFVANAASFVLPISNPANIVLYGDHTPTLTAWWGSFAWPSVASIVVTYVAMRWSVARRLEPDCTRDVPVEPLNAAIRTAAAGIVVTGAVLIVVSARDIQLGLPTAVMGALTAVAVLVVTRSGPWDTIKGVSWSILPLVAGLFVLVEALDETGLTRFLSGALGRAAASSPAATPWWAGWSIAVVSNVVNNLPAGLVASTTIQVAHPTRSIVDALLIGVDLGPNLSITGSLATILWLTAIRREGEDVGFWRFLGVGALVMPPALAAALLLRLGW